MLHDKMNTPKYKLIIYIAAIFTQLLNNLKNKPLRNNSLANAS